MVIYLNIPKTGLYTITSVEQDEYNSHAIIFKNGEKEVFKVKKDSDEEALSFLRKATTRISNASYAESSSVYLDIDDIDNEGLRYK